VVKKGKWAKSIDFCYWDYPLMELGGLTLGIVGFGRIGKAVVNIAQAFGMKVLINSRNTIRKLPAGTRQVEVEELFSESDIVSLHCPLTDKTEKIVNAETLGLMKPCAFVINTGRGPLVDEGALADALNDGRIAGAGVDVLSTEPPAADNPLLSAKNCYITPHIAWATRSARKRLIHIVTQNCVAFLNGSPVNMVNI
jgi:glycerate dehydrogenase